MLPLVSSNETRRDNRRIFVLLKVARLQFKFHGDCCRGGTVRRD